MSNAELIIKIIISVVTVAIIGNWQYEKGQYEYDEGGSLKWIIIKRSILFILFSAGLSLMIFAAGGGDNNDEPLRRWEEGRG